MFSPMASPISLNQRWQASMLSSMAQGSTMVLAMPCGTWNMPPMGYDSACTAPTPALPKAMPPIMAPMAMFSRAHMLLPSYTAVRMLLLMSLMPS